MRIRKKHFTGNAGMQKIDNSIANIFSKLSPDNKKNLFIIQNLIKNWNEIIPSNLIKSCYPKSINFTKNSAKLTITASNSQAAFYLENIEEFITEKISALYGYKIINKIIIKQELRNINIPKNEKIISKKSENKISKILENIEDEEIKKSLKELAIEIFD